MEYFEDWKRLVFHTDEELRKRKNNEDVSKPLLFALIIALVSSTLATFRGFSWVIAAFGLNQIVFYFAYAALAATGFFLIYYLIHLLARWLGGKGEYVAMVSVMAEFLLPISLAELAGFIPYIGDIISIILGFASLYAFWIAYKFLRIKHKLSKAKSLAALFGGMFICVFIFLAILGAIAYQYVYAFLESGGVQPTVTITKDGNHFYSPLHGGYSFDYPSDWEWLNLNRSKETRIVMAINQNELISLDAFVNGKTNQSLGVAFFPRNKNQEMDCSTKTIQMAGTRSEKMDVGAATAELVVIENYDGALLKGERVGCLIKGMRYRETDTVTDSFLTSNCSQTHYLTVTSDNLTMLTIIAGGIRCGSEAVK